MIKAGLKALALVAVGYAIGLSSTVCLYVAAGYPAPKLTMSSASEPSHERTPKITPEAKPTAAQIEANARTWTVEVWIKLDDGSRAPASGIVISSGGKILTCNHVVASQQEGDIEVAFADGRRFPAHTIKADRTKDLALLQLDAQGLAIAPLAKESAHVKVGDTVYAIGSPVGFHWRFSKTQIINTSKFCGLRDLRCLAIDDSGEIPFIAPGNSGGAMLDRDGNVVGINRAIHESTKEGLTVPIEEVFKFLKQ